MRLVSFGAVIGCLLFICSCVKDRCKDTVCNNDGVCVEGYCSCLNGYEGEHCDEVWNERFMAEWDVLESIPAGTTFLMYSMGTIPTGAPDEFMVMNLHDSLDSIVCKRTSYYTFSITQRHVADSTFYLRSGSGTMDSSGNTITAFYILQEGDTTIRYNTTWSK